MAATRPRALIVDDDAAVRASMAMLLLSMGVDSSLAENGAAAMNHIGQDRYDLAMVDVGLPDIDGCTLAEKLQGKAPDVAIVLVSGHNAAQVMQETGTGRVLEKPISVRQVRDILNNVLPAGYKNGW